MTRRGTTGRKWLLLAAIVAAVAALHAAGFSRYFTLHGVQSLLDRKSVV